MQIIWPQTEGKLELVWHSSFWIGFSYFRQICTACHISSSFRNVWIQSNEPIKEKSQQQKLQPTTTVGGHHWDSSNLMSDSRTDLRAHRKAQDVCSLMCYSRTYLAAHLSNRRCFTQTTWFIPETWSLQLFWTEGRDVMWYVNVKL